MAQQPNQQRGLIVFIFLIIVGLVIGFIIKRVHIGLIIGLALGFLSSGLLRRK
ncbi:MAG: hypothetical protein ABR502_00840 [Chitinophagaceae bacterium]